MTRALARRILLLAICCAHGFTYLNAAKDIDAEKVRETDPLGYDAIRQLHKEMDDDLSGGVDLTESSEFLREELHVNEKERLARRQQNFHNNDDLVTVDELWRRWLESGERRWTVEDTLDWLIRSVELPQYAESFSRNAIDGTSLPKMAAQNMSFIQNVLGVLNPVHRQKLQLKAMDVVLFGYRGTKPSYVKDMLLVTLLVLACGAYWFAMYQRKASLKQAHQLTSQLEKLKDIEQEFQELQSKIAEEQENSSKSDGMESEAIESLKYQLQKATERQLEQRSLQGLLQKTYELEIQRIQQQKIESLREMNEARELVEKLRKKQSSLMSQIRSVHGSETEMIDERIVSVRQKVERTAQAMEECENRWAQIQYLVGYDIGCVNPLKVPGSFPTKGSATFHRPHVFTTSSDAEIDDLTDLRGYNDGKFGSSYVSQLAVTGLTQRPPLKSTSTSKIILATTANGLPVSQETAQKVTRPTCVMSARSSSANDLVQGNGLSPSDGISPPGVSSQIQQRIPPPLLEQIGKSESQASMQSSNSSGHGKKRKILKIFGGRDKKD